MLCTFTFRFLEMSALRTFYSVIEHIITKVHTTVFFLLKLTK